MIYRFLAAFYILCTTSVAYAATLDRSGYTQTFADEFEQFDWRNESIVGNTKGTWRTHFGYTWCPRDDVRNRTLSNNAEQQLYVDPAFHGTGEKPLGLSAIEAKGGMLRITATHAPDKPELSGYKYLSGFITTEGKFSQTYGLFEMRAKLPKGKGLWPAFWLMPVKKQWPPEIDIMEVLGHKITEYHTTLHSKVDGKYSMNHLPTHTVPDLSAGFHTYAVDWGPQEMVFYFDDREVARTPTPADMHQPFFILANLAVGGKWPGNPDESTHFPAVMEIDWIRVWQKK